MITWLQSWSAMKKSSITTCKVMTHIKHPKNDSVCFLGSIIHKTKKTINSTFNHQLKTFNWVVLLPWYQNSLVNVTKSYSLSSDIRRLYNIYTSSPKTLCKGAMIEYIIISWGFNQKLKLLVEVILYIYVLAFQPKTKTYGWSLRIRWVSTL